MPSALPRSRTLKSARTKTKKQLKAIDASLLTTARQTLDAMAPTDAPTQVMGVLRSRIEKLVTDHYATIERSTLAWYNNLADKYGTTLRDLETERDNAATRLDSEHLKELGVWVVGEEFQRGYCAFHTRGQLDGRARTGLAN